MTKRGRNISGILLLNKPVGISSNAALQRAKRLFQARKAGHTGSLDNLASGLLPICFGEATKLASFLLDADKHYRVEATLGATSTTGDAEGEIIATLSPASVDRERIAAVTQTFLGTHPQIPPMYSALKCRGQPLYRLARQGQTVERLARPVTIYALTIVDFVDNRLTFAVHCSKGTYVRTLVEEIGNALGCGAYVSALQRTQVGIFKEMLDFSTIEAQAEQGLTALDSLLIPMHTALPHLPQITVSPDHAKALYQGQTVTLSSVTLTGLMTLFTETGLFLGIGQVFANGHIAPKRLLNNPLLFTICHPK